MAISGQFLVAADSALTASRAAASTDGRVGRVRVAGLLLIGLFKRSAPTLMMVRPSRGRDSGTDCQSAGLTFNWTVWPREVPFAGRADMTS